MTTEALTEPPSTAAPGTTADGASGRRCRRRTVEPGGSRPSDVLVAFFGAGLLMLVAAAGALIASVVGHVWWAHWLALHLALLGGVSQLVLGAGQFFVCAFLATTPPRRRLLVTQAVVWNAGTVLVAVGVPAGSQPLVDVGAGLILAGLALFSYSLRAMQGRSLQQARWAVRWYQASASCLAAGALIGVLLAGGVSWSHGSLLGSHLALNLIGWMGTAIVGTLHTFFPSLTGTQLRFARLQGPTLRLWLLGVLAMAIAAAFAIDALAVCAWLALTAAAALLAVNIAASLRARTAPLSLPTRLVSAGHCFLVAGLAVAVITATIGGAGAPLAGATRAALAALLMAGWIGLTVAGSLLHLLAVLARIRHHTKALPAPRRLPELALTILCVVAVAAWALAAVRGLGMIGSAALALRGAAAAILAALILRAAITAGRALAPRRRPGHAHP